MPGRNIVFLVAVACLAGCGGNTDPNNKGKTQLSSAPANSAAAHMVSASPDVRAAPAAFETVAGPRGQAPGFAGVWASDAAACKDKQKIWTLSAQRLDMGAERGCAVTSIHEEHPTGRSMIYHIEGACIGEKRAANQAITLRFGASDTVMQVQVDGGAPEQVVRCPPAEAPRETPPRTIE